MGILPVCQSHAERSSRRSRHKFLSAACADSAQPASSWLWSSCATLRSNAGSIARIWHAIFTDGHGWGFNKFSVSWLSILNGNVCLLTNFIYLWPWDVFQACQCTASSSCPCAITTSCCHGENACVLLWSLCSGSCLLCFCGWFFLLLCLLQQSAAPHHPSVAGSVSAAPTVPVSAAPSQSTGTPATTVVPSQSGLFYRSGYCVSHCVHVFSVQWRKYRACQIQKVFAMFFFFVMSTGKSLAEPWAKWIDWYSAFPTLKGEVLCRWLTLLTSHPCHFS